MRITLKSNAAQVKQLFDSYPEISKQVREEIVTSAIKLLEREVVLKTPEGAGPYHLRETFFSKVATLGIRCTGTLGTPAIYGEAVEYGTKPHFPPIGPLVKWVEWKFGLEGKEAKSVAYAIAIKIADVGTEGAHMVQYAWEDNEYLIYRLIEQIPGKILSRLPQ